jgi:hypothetical protein
MRADFFVTAAGQVLLIALCTQWLSGSVWVEAELVQEALAKIRQANAKIA